MNIYTLIKAQVEKTPHSVAAVFGKRKLSYKELDLEIGKMCTCLKNSGVKKGDIVGVSLKRSLEMVIALLGIVKSGAAYLPLDPNFPAERLKFMIDDSECPFLITEDSLKNAFSYYRGKLIDIDEYRSHVVKPTDDDNFDENGLAYIIYTSGSTGNPKGVQITNRSLINFLQSMKKVPGISDRDSLLAITTLSFDISGLEIYLPLISGAKLIIASKEEAQDAHLLLNKLKSVSIMQATPSTWKMLLDAGWNEKLNLKALCGGEALTRDLADKLLPRVGSLWNMYGPTETTIWSSVAKVEQGTDIIHLGRPIDNTQFYIVDKNNRFCAPGVAGELLIGGEGLSIGYLKRDDLTTEKFIVNPFDKEKKTKVYRTGDLVRLTANNKLEFLGRLDNQVKLRGFRIELGEIEALIRKNKRVKDTAVIVREFEKNDSRLVAWIVAQSNEDNKSNYGVEKWQNEWNYLYKTAVDKAGDGTRKDFNLDFEAVKVVTEDESHLVDGFNEWFSQTIDRIKSLNPERVLEIGCGGGQILKQLAPNCSFYAATDFAESSIKILENQLINKPDNYAQIELLVKEANAELPFKKYSFDTVIINSVAQYFPGYEYFAEVIIRALDMLSEGGVIYLGDIQSYSLLKNHHLNDQINHLYAGATVGDFKRIIENRTKNEEELVVDPDFFYALKKVHNLGRVEIKLRRGKSLNETTRYHYDVFIYPENRESSSSDYRQMNWGKETSSLDEIKDFISKESPELLYISNIPNSRLSINIENERIINASSDEELVQDVIGKVKGRINDIDPEDLWDLGSELNYNVDLILSGNCDQSYFDAVFIYGNNKIRYPIRNSDINFKELKSYTNTPSNVVTNQRLIEELKEEMRKMLPEYMVPSFFIPIECLPLTPNGKIDRIELGKSKIYESATPQKVIQPETAGQKMLLKIWEKLLHIDGIGIDDNFFELGGHSILAAQMFTDIEKETGDRIPLATLFKAQTIRELDKLLKKPEVVNASWSPLVEIKKGNNRDPLFLVHGAEGNILLYRELSEYLNHDQSIYGLQSRGLNGYDMTVNSIEEMARDYIKVIKQIRPQGPYNIGGYCMGGTIAYEIAQQLQEEGEMVKNLFMLETYNVCKSLYVDSLRDRTKIKVENIKFHWKNIKTLKGKDRITFIFQKASVQKRRMITRINSICKKLRIKNSAEYFTSAETLTVRRVNDEAQVKYQPKPYSGNVILLKPKESYSSETDPKFGWDHLINGSFKLYNLNVAPRGMLLEPFVIETASIITMEIGEDPSYNKKKDLILEHN